MDKNRMQKLAGIREGTLFKNGKFKLERFDVWQTSDDEIMKEVSPDGDFCDSNQVSKLEELVAELMEVVEMAEENYYDEDGDEQSVARAARAIIKKAKSL